MPITKGQVLFDSTTYSSQICKLKETKEWFEGGEEWGIIV
jgi:hypothetical protein